MKKVLVTGGAGFIGSTLVDFLLQNTQLEIVCVDNFDPYYAENLKRQNVASAVKNPRFTLIEEDICNLAERAELKEVDTIVHLAAKAGVRPSIKDPMAYAKVNVLGTQNLLELARKLGIKQFVFASSSSVYGVNPNYPWSESDNVLLPISPYAATKLSDEFLGSVYANLYDMRFLALRFFTVYGPRQRPDLAINKFVHKIKHHEPIDMYGDGTTKRDYTYVTDTVAGIWAAMNYAGSKYEIINIGNNNPITLSELIANIETAVGEKARINRLPDQQGDVPVTFADTSKAAKLLGYQPQVTIQAGLKLYVDSLTDD